MQRALHCITKALYAHTSYTAYTARTAHGRKPMENIIGGFGQISNHKVRGARAARGTERTTQHNRTPFESRRTQRAGSSFRTESADYIFHLDFPVSPLDSNADPLSCVFGPRLAPPLVRLLWVCSDSLLRRSADYIFHRRLLTSLPDGPGRTEQTCSSKKLTAG